MLAKSRATRESILAASLNIVSESGLTTFTLDRVALQVGIPKSEVLAHFESPRALILAILQEMTNVWMKTTVNPLMPAHRGLARLKLYMNAWLSWPQRAGLSGGCILAAALFELDDARGEIRDVISASDLEWRLTLEELVLAAMKQKELRADLDIDQFASEIWGIYLNHHVASRFRNDPSAIQRATRAFEDLISRNLA